MASLENFNGADCNRAISELMSLLKKEIKLLRVGKLSDIDHMAKAKAEKTKFIAEQMAKLDTGVARADGQNLRYQLGPRLAALQTLSRENGLLLQGVMRGVQSAHMRIQALHNKESQVGIYGRQGKALAFEEQTLSKEISF